MTLNEKIVLLRKSNGWTQQELGDKLNVTDKAVSKWESSNGTPDIEQLQSLSDVFSVSLDYLMKDVVTIDGDKNAYNKINNYKNKLAKIEEKNRLIDQCKSFLEEQGIHTSEDIFPFIEEDGCTINMGCFIIDNEKKISLSFDKLIEYKQIDLIVKFYPDRILPLEAVEMDDVDLFELSLKCINNLQSEYNKLPKEGWGGFQYTTNPEELNRINRSRQLKPVINKNNLNTVLEKLNPNLKNYYYFIVRLIDEGATYLKQEGHGDDVTCFNYVPDISKTNFIYRVAKDMIK